MKNSEYKERESILLSIYTPYQGVTLLFMINLIHNTTHLYYVFLGAQ